MNRLRLVLVVAATVTAGAVWGLRPDPRAAAVAVLVALAATVAAVLPRGDTAAVVLALLVVEAALTGDRAPDTDRLLLALVLAMVLWALHAGYAFAAATVGAGPAPPADIARYAAASTRLLAVALPGVIALALLAFLPRTTGLGSGLLRVAGLLAAAFISALPVLLQRRSRAR